MCGSLDICSVTGDIQSAGETGAGVGQGRLCLAQEL